MDTIDYTPPPRPDGVPDDAVPAVLWFGPEDEHRITTIYYPKGTGRRSSEGLVDRARLECRRTWDQRVGRAS